MTKKASRLHKRRRLIKTPEWQAFRRHCELYGDYSATVAEETLDMSAGLLRRFTSYATEQRRLYFLLLTGVTE